MRSRNHIAVCLTSLLAATMLPACFYIGGDARTTIDLETKRPSYSMQGQFGGFTQSGITDDVFEPVDERSGVYFALSAGVVRDTRLGQWQGVAGPRIGWLWPRGLTELAFETRFGGDEPKQLFAFMLSVGPRVELRRKQSSHARSATVLSPRGLAGFSVGDGFRPELGAAVGVHNHWWAPRARYD